MLENQSSGVLDQILPAVNLLEEIIGLGLSLIKGLMDEVTCQKWIRKLLIRMLSQPIKYIYGREIESLYNTVQFDSSLWLI